MHFFVTIMQVSLLIHNFNRDDRGGSGGGGGIFGAISINNVIGYHLDLISKNGTRIYMPVTSGFKTLNFI